MTQFASAITAAVVAVLASLVTTSFAANRRHMKMLQDADAPMPPYHPVFGHLLAVKEALSTLPRGVTNHVMVRLLASRFPNGVFYLNLWPFNKTLMVVSDPFVASQVEKVMDRPPTIRDTIDTINGGPSLLTMTGDEWKQWRTVFAPGFASGYMTGLAPAVAEEVAGLCETLKKRAAGGMFQLEEDTLRMTFDVIARVTLGSRLRYQTQDNALADGIRSQILWTPFKTSFNPIKRWLNPQALIQAYNSWRINRYLEGEIDKRFDEVASLSATTSRSGSESESRSIISLALDQFLADSGGDLSPRSRRAFKDTAIPQMRMFLYAGHDTTSSTLLYVFYLLSRHPHVLDKVRAEHDAVLGPDRSAEHCQAAIASDPALVNRLPYTLAVIKEVLRVFPPAGSIRYGRPGLHLVDQEGRKYPTEDCFVWTVSLIAHHHPDNHARPEEFLPERYLVGPNDPLYPKKGTWRAFEWGPRSCLGQTLAILELKIALVLTARAFDIKPAYDELDRLNQPKGVVRAGGERAYQSELGGGGAHPADGMPVRVTLRA